MQLSKRRVHLRTQGQFNSQGAVVCIKPVLSDPGSDPRHIGWTAGAVKPVLAAQRLVFALRYGIVQYTLRLQWIGVVEVAAVGAHGSGNCVPQGKLRYGAVLGVRVATVQPLRKEYQPGRGAAFPIRQVVRQIIGRAKSLAHSRLAQRTGHIQFGATQILPQRFAGGLQRPVPGMLCHGGCPGI